MATGAPSGELADPALWIIEVPRPGRTTTRPDAAPQTTRPETRHQVSREKEKIGNLSTVHGIVKACGGVIAVESEPEKGAAFDVYLPFAETATQKERLEDKPIRGDGERVLVVDDEKNLADLMGRQLEFLGYEVTVRTSSVAALRDFRGRPHHFALIITDNIMPKMTGRNLIREVRRLRKDIPVIVISGHIDSMSAEETKKPQISGFLSKPFGARALGLAVRNVLNEAKRTNASLPASTPDSCAPRGEMER